MKLQKQEFALPLMGSTVATRQTYYVKYLVLPARDIATTIAKADPGGNKLPTRLRGWSVEVTDEWRNRQRIHLKKLLGMVIHTYYLSIGNGDLDVSNDLGRRVIVPYSDFLHSVERLVLPPEDIWLVVCGLAEEQIKTRNSRTALQASTPGAGDLSHCLYTIKNWPTLQEIIWNTFFAGQSTTVGPDCQTANESPFIQRGSLVGNTVMWRVGWRRNDTYSASWIDVSRLIRQIQDYFMHRPRV
ncbi:MAG: hypothetical protein OXT71_04445 [Acidobacteriota bacterium]|nr:hypothetical protein [Acidobacteriota bacterium]